MRLKLHIADSNLILPNGECLIDPGKHVILDYLD